MKLLVISYERLISNGTAGTAVMGGLVEAALHRGWEVTYVALCTSLSPESWEIPFDFGSDAHHLEHIQLLYERKPQGAWQRFIGTFNHTAVSRLLDQNNYAKLGEKYDGVIAFDSLAIGLSRDVIAKKKVLIIGDPAGRRIWYPASWLQPILKLKACLVEIAELGFFFSMSRRYTLAMFGSGHAKFWSRALIRKVLDLRPFLRSPVVDLDGQRGDSPIVYFGGSLAGTASRQSVSVIFDEILPALRARFGRGKFELRLVGDTTELFQRWSLPHGEVKLMGRVPCFEKELSAGDVFILPINYPVGVRTRVCSALAAGNYCLVHPSVLFNMPELAECEAVKTVESAADYSAAIAELPIGAARIRLRKTARLFFDNYYCAQVASAPLLNVF
jgi:hypothetical protein